MSTPRRPSRNRSNGFRMGIVAQGLATAFATPAMANPVGPVVVNGAANLSSSGKNLTVTNTPGAILDWRSFSIDAGESVRFQSRMHPARY